MSSNCIQMAIKFPRRKALQQWPAPFFCWEYSGPTLNLTLVPKVKTAALPCLARHLTPTLKSGGDGQRLSLRLPSYVTPDLQIVPFSQLAEWMGQTKWLLPFLWSPSHLHLQFENHKGYIIHHQTMMPEEQKNNYLLILALELFSKYLYYLAVHNSKNVWGWYVIFICCIIFIITSTIYLD